MESFLLLIFFSEKSITKRTFLPLKTIVTVTSKAKY